MTVLVSASSSCLRRLPGLEGWHVVKLLLTCCVICMEEKGLVPLVFSNAALLLACKTGVRIGQSIWHAFLAC